MVASRIDDVRIETNIEQHALRKYGYFSRKRWRSLFYPRSIHVTTEHPRRVTTRHFFSMDRLRFLRLVCVLALGTPRCVHFASIHAARHRTNRSTRAYLRGDLAMVRATKPARASPRAFAKRAAVDSRFLSLSAFSSREVTKNPKRASTGPSSRGETRARRNESARVPRVPAPRARATLVYSTTHRGSLTEAHPPNRARTRRLAGTSPMTRTLFEHARS